MENEFYLGLKIFQQEYLNYFKRKNLNLEKHFKYTISSEAIDVLKMDGKVLRDVLHTPWVRLFW